MAVVGIETRVKWEVDKWMNVLFCLLINLIIVVDLTILQSIRLNKQRKNVHPLISIPSLLSVVHSKADIHSQSRSSVISRPS